LKQQSPNPRILFVVNEAAFFISHRLPIALAAIDKGYDVAVAAPPSDHRNKLEGLGIRFFPIPLLRRTATPSSEIKTLFALFRLIRTFRPKIVHAVTVKPVIYSGLASQLAGVPRFIGAISGLGHVFLSSGTFARARRALVCLAYKLAFRGSGSIALFQNPDDRELFIQLGIVPQQKTALIRGSGVDPTVYDAGPPPPGPPIVMLASRLLREKGVPEFIAAAEILRARNVNARFVLVGKPDYGNPSSMTEEELSNAVASGTVEWWGHRDDMISVLQQASIVCLPSHGEGLPRILLEAASCRRPIIATDVPGCREIVLPGQNGLLVPVQSPEELAKAISILLAQPDRAAEYGERGRQLVIDQFSIQRVVQLTLELYTC